MDDGFTVWLTGFAGSDTDRALALALESRLRRRGVQHVQRLDGDAVRRELAPQDGAARANGGGRPLVFFAELLSNNGVGTIVVRAGPEQPSSAARLRCLNLIEVRIRSPEANGADGVADTGPDRSDGLPAEVSVDPGRETVERSLQKIVVALERRGWIPPLVVRSRE